MKTYGQPPRPLLGAGIARRSGRSPDAEVRRRRLPGRRAPGHVVRAAGRRPHAAGAGLPRPRAASRSSWNSRPAVSGSSASPARACSVLVFLSSYVAGLSGHEPLVLFAIGVILLALELIFFHTAGFLGAVGVACILGSLLWTMADLWPSEPISTAWSADAFTRPLLNLGVGIGIATALTVALLRYPAARLVLGPADRELDGPRRGPAGQRGPGNRCRRWPAWSAGAASRSPPCAPAARWRSKAAATRPRSRWARSTAAARCVVCGRNDFGLVVEKAEG